MERLHIMYHDGHELFAERISHFKDTLTTLNTRRLKELNIHFPRYGMLKHSDLGILRDIDSILIDSQYASLELFALRIDAGIFESEVLAALEEAPPNSGGNTIATAGSSSPPTPPESAANLVQHWVEEALQQISSRGILQLEIYIWINHDHSDAMVN